MAAYGENPNRMQHYYQFQVVPACAREYSLNSTWLSKELGFDLKRTMSASLKTTGKKNPTLGAWGLGWEVWMNGMEVTQFHLFPAGWRY